MAGGMICWTGGKVPEIGDGCSKYTLARELGENLDFGSNFIAGFGYRRTRL